MTNAPFTETHRATPKRYDEIRQRAARRDA